MVDGGKVAITKFTFRVRQSMEERIMFFYLTRAAFGVGYMLDIAQLLMRRDIAL